jgi:hypothetical protein
MDNNEIYAYFKKGSDEFRTRCNSFCAENTIFRLENAPKLRPKISLVEPTPMSLNSNRAALNEHKNHLDDSEYAETVCSASVLAKETGSDFVNTNKTTSRRTILKYLQSKAEVQVLACDEVYVEFD